MTEEGKRWRRGDIHPETGLAFFGYRRECTGGEYWVTPEKIEEERRKRRKNPEKKKKQAPVTREEAIASSGKEWRRGDIHPETGLIFYSYKKIYSTGECWLRPEKFEEQRVQMVEWRKRQKGVTKGEAILASGVHRKRGDIDPKTGKLFWQYGKLYPKGEQWVTREGYGKMIVSLKKYCDANKQKHREACKKHLLKDIEKTKQNRRKHYLNRVPRILARAKERRKTDPVYLIKCRIRSRVKSGLKTRKMKKDCLSRDILGCDWDFLRDYLQARFLPGMGWENRLLWDIDHIIPLASAKTIEDVKRLCHYTNLQPLWSSDNRKKGSRISETHKTLQSI